MRRVALVCLLLIFPGAYAYSAADPVKAWKSLHQKHLYQSAGEKLRSTLSSLPEAERDAARLSLAMSCLENARLHQELYELSQKVQLDYLQKVAAVKGKGKSHLVNLYLGETLLASGQVDKASRALEAAAADQSLTRKSRTLARIKLGMCRQIQGRRTQARKIWNGLNSLDPESLSELAAVYSRFGVAGQNPVAMIERAGRQAEAAGEGGTVRLLKNTLEVYIRAGKVEEGLAVLAEGNPKEQSGQEPLGKNKILRFYDVELLGRIAELYEKAAIFHLEQILARDPGHSGARHFLAETYLYFGDPVRSLKQTEALLAAGAPGPLRDRAEIRKAVVGYRAGDLQARERLRSFSRQADPGLLAYLLQVCDATGAECGDLVADAGKLADAMNGRAVSGLYAAIGKTFVSRGDWNKALFYLEAGRDKSNKNRLEYNDPLMFVHLAEGYYRTLQFSEALEILFAMSQEFPAVRQLQEALQGIYAIEQKSAGDVKIL